MSLLCSVVIPTKNGGALFAEAVRGLQAQQGWAAVDFIIIDSGSTDATIAIATAAGARCIAIPPADFNHGLTRDLAIAHARAERVVLLVQDAVPADDHLLERLVAALDDRTVAGVYGRQVPRPDADVITRRNLREHFRNGARPETRQLVDEQPYAQMAPEAKHALCTFDNVCSAIRRSVWQHEPFGPNGFGEDIIWAERVLKRGHKIVYEPAAVVIHSHDRPLAYEYTRAYVCHRLLHRRFGLTQVPNLARAGVAWLHAVFRDGMTIVRDERRPLTALWLLAKAPVANLMLIAAKYRAERDERRGVSNSVADI